MPVLGELVSALMDGQLRGTLLTNTVQAVAQDREALTRWRDYHLIGEVLRIPAAQQVVALSNPPFDEKRLGSEDSASLGPTQTLTRRPGNDGVTAIDEVPLGTLKLFVASLERQR